MWHTLYSTLTLDLKRLQQDQNMTDYALYLGTGLETSTTRPKCDQLCSVPWHWALRKYKTKVWQTIKSTLALGIKRIRHDLSVTYSVQYLDIVIQVSTTRPKCDRLCTVPWHRTWRSTTWPKCGGLCTVPWNWALRKYKTKVWRTVYSTLTLGFKKVQDQSVTDY